jgi:DNA-binding transcriptional regulator YdaS (Cro superfamily)
MQNKIYDKVIQQAANGNQSQFARMVGVSPQLLTHWRKTRIPADRVVAVCRLAGESVKPHDIRPDIFLPEWTV